MKCKPCCTFSRQNIPRLHNSYSTHFIHLQSFVRRLALHLQMAPAVESEANASKPSSQTGPPPTVASVDLPSQLKWYYSRLFPISLFGRWLSYGNEEYLARREISFTLPGDIYLRWRSFSSTEELHTALKNQTPVKIDIGAVYNFPPKDKSTVTATLSPEAKELVFDIDLTDYEDVIRDLGDYPNENATERCDRHWAYMETAVQVLDTALREDFGFKRILWIYSGRRGIHAWICDAKARLLNNAQRASIADYLNVKSHGNGALKSLGAPPLHPALARARKICNDLWVNHILYEQLAITDPDRARSTLEDVTREGVKMNDGWFEKCINERKGDPDVRWQNFEADVKRNKSHWEYSHRAIGDYIVLKHTYPRLDVNVSKEINHLLKAPFCVHPKTGRVCVPFRAKDVRKFNPANDAPLAAKLIAEIGGDNGNKETKKMDAALDIFREFVEELEKDTKEAMQKEQLRRLDARGVREVLA